MGTTDDINVIGSGGVHSFKEIGFVRIVRVEVSEPIAVRMVESDIACTGQPKILFVKVVRDA